MTSGSPGLIAINAEKSLALASALFPWEKWVFKESGIWVAESRLFEESKEPEKWEREMSQVRILTNRGSAAYFLPERNMCYFEDPGELHIWTYDELRAVIGKK
jgi:hypothetical protein